MKILFFITSLDVGGAERQVLDLAAKLISYHHDVLVIYLTGSGRLLSSKEAFKTVGLQSEKSVSGFFKSFFKLRSLIRSFKPDVVHSHMVHANLMARLVRLFVRIPRLICTAHSNNEGGKLRMYAYRITNFLADVTTNVSQGAVEAFESKGAVTKGQMLVVPNGIDTDKYVFNPLSRSEIRKSEHIGNDQKIILAVGRLVEAKDYPVLIHAFKILCAEDDSLLLWIVGDGHLKEELVALSIKLKISNRIKFFGVRENVADYYSCADVYVLSSAWEGFGLVVAEAMAAERVVVATDCGGVKEVVGDNGIMVDPGNIKDMAAAIKKALEMDPTLAKTLGKQARDRVIGKYSLESIVLIWLEIYARLKI